MLRHAMEFRLAQELGKHLHEVLGWAGPMTHPQALGWQVWLLGDPEEIREAGIKEADARIQAAVASGHAVEVRRSENKPGKAAELLNAGVTKGKRKDRRS